MSVFISNPYIGSKYWVGLEDIDASILSAWRDAASCSGWNVNASSSTLFRYPFMQFERSSRKNGLLQRLVKQEISTFDQKILKPHFYMLTDTEGMMLQSFGEPLILEQLANIGMLEGASFRLEHAGINAVSVAIQTKQMSLVRGEEHTLHLFSNWTCICAPITDGKRILGYLDFSLHKDEDAAFAAAILYKLIADIEKALLHVCGTMRTYHLHLKQYRLTPREVEVAARWLDNNTTAQIAADLFISEETVRTYIKKIYKKTGTKGKGAFLQKFLLDLNKL